MEYTKPRTHNTPTSPMLTSVSQVSLTKFYPSTILDTTNILTLILLNLFHPWLV